MSLKTTVINSTMEVKEVGERSAVTEKEMSFRSMLEQFYKKSFELLPEPELPTISQSFIAAR